MLNASFQEQTKRTNKKKAIERKKQFRRAQKFVSRQVQSIKVFHSFLDAYSADWLPREQVIKSTKNWRGRADHRQTLDEVRPENRSDSPAYPPNIYHP